MSKELTSAITPEQEAQLNSNLDVARKIDAAANALTEQQLHFAQQFGSINAFGFFEQMSGITRIKWLKERKESRDFIGQKISQKGVIITLNNFDDVCACIGTSASKAYEDLQNLEALGDKYFEAVQQMGLSRKDLRVLRKLPESDLKAITSTDDPEELRELLEETLAEKAKAEKDAKEAKDTIVAKENILDKKNKALDKTLVELAKFKNIPPKEAVKIQREKEIAALKELHEDGLTFNGAFTAYLAKARGILEDDDTSPHTKKLVHELTSGLCSMFTQELLDAGLDIDLAVLIYPASINALLGAEPVMPEAESEA